MFGLAFLQPAFLLAGLAAGVPILIHLINRHRALVHRFPALRFLLMADRRTARKFRLYQLLLLALRVLAILLLALLLSQPRWGDEASAALALPPQATVVLLDNSLSMQLRDGQETRLERAKTLAGQLLEGIAAPDSAVVLPLVTDDADTDAKPPLLGADAAALWDQVRAVSASHAAVDIAAAVQRAIEILQESTAPRRRLMLLTDLTVHGWEGFRVSDLPRVPEDLVVHVIRLGLPQRDANALISGVRVTEPPFIEQTPLDVTVWVRNYSDEPVRNLRVDLLLGGETVGQQLTDLAADEEVAVPFRIVAPEVGLHWGEVRLQGDAFTEDDRFYVALQTVAPARVLVVDGDPGTSLFESETFYLLSALQPRGSLGSPLFHPKPLVWEGLEQERLSDYSVIVLCNVEALSPQVRQGLHQFVTDGGGLIFFAGHQVDATRYNTLFYGSDTPLLPAALGEPVQLPEETPVTLQLADGAHEALAVFNGGAADMLTRSRFYRYFSVAEDEAGEADVLLSYDDGRPFLLERSLGRGRVLLFTSTADRDWTDLPTRTAYVPLMHSLVGYAAQLSEAAKRPQVFLPGPTSVRIQGAQEGGGLTILTPDGKELLSRFAGQEGVIEAPVTEYTVPGIYRLSSSADTDYLAVNATRAESDFAKLQQPDLQARWQPLSVILEEEAALGEQADGAALPGREIAGMLLLALVAVLMVENVCANRL
jgi:hypothetical protein